jgi:hypothetical protein
MDRAGRFLSESLDDGRGGLAEEGLSRLSRDLPIEL